MPAQEDTIIPAANSEASTEIVALPTHPVPVTPADKALTFVKEHPVLTVAGGLAAGLLISALIPRRARQGLKHRALGLAKAGSAAALTFGQSALDKADDGSVFAREKAKVLANQAEKLGGKAAARAERMGAAALGAAGSWGHAAAERADKLSHVAASKAETIGVKASAKLTNLSDKALARSSKALTTTNTTGTFDRLMTKLRELLTRMR